MSATKREAYRARGKRLKLEAREADAQAEVGEPVCVCKKKRCTRTACKGECGCKACHNAYQDFLSGPGDWD